jgi:formylglycine-generating enzyme required for sulfatase activity
LRYAEAEADRKRALAFSLAEYGEVDANFLCSQIKSSGPEEVDNLVTAFGHSRELSLKVVHELAVANESEQNWRQKFRSAVVALYMDDTTIAADMCRVDDRPDPVQRSVFIDEFPAWHGDLEKLASHCEKLSDPAVRSAVVMGLGSIPADRLAAPEIIAWKPVISRWYETAPDNVTHSAANWALRQWNVALPPIPSTTEPVERRHWYVNSLGMSMLRIEPGTFVRVDMPMGIRSETRQTVTLTRPFYLSDREVSVSQFGKFLDDPDYPAEDKPESRTEWSNKVKEDLSSYPMDMVNWYDALLFCNWLSRKEVLNPCYERTGKKHRILDLDRRIREYDEWGLTANGTGYRLPTDAEWEYACRAGTSTDFASGTDGELLRKYAVYSAGAPVHPSPCGSKLPNGWGLFDMHGNVFEWCYDRYGAYGTSDATDPMEPSEATQDSKRVIRGGSSNTLSVLCSQASTSAFRPVLGETPRDSESPVRPPSIPWDSTCATFRRTSPERSHSKSGLLIARCRRPGNSRDTPPQCGARRGLPMGRFWRRGEMIIPFDCGTPSPAHRSRY